MVALSARSAIERLSGLRVGLKWPNDLVVGENKLAGLLAEVVSDGDDLGVVVGIGVNLTYDGPPGVPATSVRAETGLTIAPRALLDILLEEIDARRELLETESGRAVIREEYVGALATIGQWVRVEQSDGRDLRSRGGRGRPGASAGRGGWRRQGLRRGWRRPRARHRECLTMSSPTTGARDRSGRTSRARPDGRAAWRDSLGR